VEQKSLRDEARELLRQRVEAGPVLKQELAGLFSRTATEVLNPARDGLAAVAESLQAEVRKTGEGFSAATNDLRGDIQRTLQDLHAIEAQRSEAGERLRTEWHVRSDELLAGQRAIEGNVETAAGRIEDRLGELSVHFGSQLAEFRQQSAKFHEENAATLATQDSESRNRLQQLSDRIAPAIAAACELSTQSEQHTAQQFGSIGASLQELQQSVTEGLQKAETRSAAIEAKLLSRLDEWVTQEREQYEASASLLTSLRWMSVALLVLVAGILIRIVFG
jgi:hypothetical protein